MSYTAAEYWDHFFKGEDLDWGDQWTGAFIAPLAQAGCRTALDLGCGSGNDVIRLKQAGFMVIGLDYSPEGLRLARSKLNLLDTRTSFVLADMARPLPFPAAYFDAVMSNVAAHMFSDAVTRAIFAEVRRIVRPDGLFLFHLNALEDRPLRARRKPPAVEIEANYLLEETGQTMHFFSEAYLRQLLAGWSTVDLELVTIRDRETGEPFKCVWRGVIS